MAAFFNFLTKCWAILVWWFVVAPWERVLRVRLGRKEVEFGPGLHRRIPYVDVLYRQTTRLHFSSIDPQTVTTLDNQTVTFAGVFGYVIKDLHTLYHSMQSPETTMQALVHGALAQYISTHAWTECDPDTVEQAVINELDIERYGLGEPQLSLTTYARVRTYRFILDEHAIYSVAPHLHNGERSAAPGEAA